MLVHMRRTELGDRPIVDLSVTGKELRLEDTVGDARSLLGRHAVRALAVLQNSTYLGAVDLEALADSDDDDPVGPHAGDFLPVVLRGTPAGEALAALDVHGGTRLVVLDDDASTYVGIVCLRGDRTQLCVDPERLARGGRPTP
jgi:CBS-domain-containing membrane protein